MRFSISCFIIITFVYAFILYWSTCTELEMCQYDTDAPAKGHPHPRAGILQKNEVEKGP